MPPAGDPFDAVLAVGDPVVEGGAALGGPFGPFGIGGEAGAGGFPVLAGEAEGVAGGAGDFEGGEGESGIGFGKGADVIDLRGEGDGGQDDEEGEAAHVDSGEGADADALEFGPVALAVGLEFDEAVVEVGEIGVFHDGFAVNADHDFAFDDAHLEKVPLFVVNSGVFGAFEVVEGAGGEMGFGGAVELDFVVFGLLGAAAVAAEEDAGIVLGHAAGVEFEFKITEFAFGGEVAVGVGAEDGSVGAEVGFALGDGPICVQIGGFFVENVPFLGGGEFGDLEIAEAALGGGGDEAEVSGAKAFAEFGVGGAVEVVDFFAVHPDFEAGPGGADAEGVPFGLDGDFEGGDDGEDGAAGVGVGFLGAVEDLDLHAAIGGGAEAGGEEVEAGVGPAFGEEFEGEVEVFKFAGGAEEGGIGGEGADDEVAVVDMESGGGAVDDFPAVEGGAVEEGFGLLGEGGGESAGGGEGEEGAAGGGAGHG